MQRSGGQEIPGGPVLFLALRPGMGGCAEGGSLPLKGLVLSAWVPPASFRAVYTSTPELAQLLPPELVSQRSSCPSHSIPGCKPGPVPSPPGCYPCGASELLLDPPGPPAAPGGAALGPFPAEFRALHRPISFPSNTRHHWPGAPPGRLGLSQALSTAKVM